MEVNMSAWLVLLVFAISWSAGVPSCPPGLPPACTCGRQMVNNVSLITVECANFSWPNTSFLRFVPLYAEALILQDVSFVSVPDPDAFQLTSMEEQLPFLKIRYIRMQNLNSLVDVPLHILLCSFPNVESAHLPNNTLRWLTLNASCVPSLKVLNLQWNHIHFVLNNTLNELESLANLTVDLRHNKFVCDCNLSPLLRWLPNATINMVHPEEYICADGYPEDVSGYGLMRLDGGQLRCQPDLEALDEDPWSRADHNFGFLLYAVLGFLLAVALAVAAFGFYFNFPYMRQWFKRVEKKPVMQRRRYKTLDTPA